MLNVKALSFAYNTTPVLNQISFSAKAGDHVSIIGESGSGKSTLLKLLYGTYDLDGGHIFWKDREILGPKHNLIIGPEYMKYVAQEFDLMPFTSVSENVGAFLSNFYPEEKQARIAELLEVVELSTFANTKVKTLSGGQKQRVAIARAIAREPEILLLDEPFSHIDNFKKHTLRRNLFQYIKAKQITCIVATHDKDDVISYADAMVVLHDTQIVAQGSPQALYHNPKTKRIASFFDLFNVIDNNFVYAHQLHPVAHSDLEVSVKTAYYKGHYYLIEGVINNDTIWFHHTDALEPGTKVCLSVSK